MVTNYAAAAAISMVQMLLSLEDSEKVIVIGQLEAMGQAGARSCLLGDFCAWKAWMGCKSISQTNAACWRHPQRPVTLGHSVPRGEMTRPWLIFPAPHLVLSPLPGDMVCVAVSTAKLQSTGCPDSC